ncbi:hypothetical protein ACFQT0_26465 [Hymenobacter humi]|uniref:Gliding motility-associated protein GldM C-terminal domain-containing protein n=1 Tax=Hymenobacter humi TaxID=1411620 RepID=A0ABW2UE95_9BACT
MDSVDVTYEWTVGADPRVYRSRTIRLFFENPVGPVTVRLKVNTGTATGCAAVDGKEVMGQKTLVVLPAKEAPVFGDYEGYSLSDPSRKYTIQIRNNSLLNLPEGCTYNLRDELKIGSTALFAYSGTFDPAYGAGSLEGKAVLDRKDKRAIVVEYSYSDPKKAVPGTRLRDKFIGRRK